MLRITAGEGKKPEGQSGQPRMVIKVKGQDGSEILYWMKRRDQLQKLMDTYCNSKSLELNSVSFLFNGHRLRGEQTPDELEMENGDGIDAMVHMTGGADV